MSGLFLLLAGNWILGLFGPTFNPGYAALVFLSVGQMVDALCGPVGLVPVMSTGDAADANPLGIVGCARLTGAVTGSAAT